MDGKQPPRHLDGFRDKYRKEIRMFKRVIIFTSFNGFAKVSQTEKRRLANIINSEVSSINEHLAAKATIESLDGQYRAFLFNDEAPAMAEFIEKLKAFAESSDGVSIRVFEIDESEYNRLPLKQKDFLAAANGNKIFEA